MCDQRANNPSVGSTCHVGELTRGRVILGRRDLKANHPTWWRVVYNIGDYLFKSQKICFLLNIEFLIK